MPATTPTDLPQLKTVTEELEKERTRAKQVRIFTDRYFSNFKFQKVSMLVDQLRVLMSDHVSEDPAQNHKRLLGEILEEKKSHEETLKTLEEERKKSLSSQQRIRELVQSQATTLSNLEHERQLNDSLRRLVPMGEGRTAMNM